MHRTPLTASLAPSLRSSAALYVAAIAQHRRHADVQHCYSTTTQPSHRSNLPRFVFQYPVTTASNSTCTHCTVTLALPGQPRTDTSTVVSAPSSTTASNMARRLLTSAAPLLTRRPPLPAVLSAIPHRTFALNSSSTHTAASSMTGQSEAGSVNNQAAGSKTGINATQQGQKLASPHSTQPANDKDVTQRPATSSPTGGAGLGVGEMSINSETAGSYHAQADKQGGQLGQGMGDKHTHEVHKDRAGKGVVPGTGNATSGDETIGGTGNAGSQDTPNSMDKASTGSKGSTAGSKTLGGSGRRGFATKASSGASSSTGNTMSTSGIGSAGTSGTKTGSSSGGTTAGKSSNSSSSGSGSGSQTSGATSTASAAGTTGSGSSSGGAKSNLGTSSSGGASTTNSTNSPGMGGAGSAGSAMSGATGKSNTPAGSGSTASTDGTTTESNSGQAGGVGSTGSPRVGGSVGGGAARANTGEHSPSGTAGGVGTGGTTTMESMKEKVRDYTGDVHLPAASSYTVIAAVLLGVPILFVLDPDRAYLKKKHMEREKQLQEEYH